MKKRTFDISEYSISSNHLNETCNPSWLDSASPTTQKLYWSIKEVVKVIEKQIEETEKLPLRKRKLVKSQIAQKAGVDKSLLDRRRQPEIAKLVESENIRLVKLYEKSSIRKTRPVLTRGSMRMEIARLNRKLEKLKKQKISEAFLAGLDSELLESQKQLAIEVRHLRIKNLEQEKTIDNLRSLLKKYKLSIVKD